MPGFDGTGPRGEGPRTGWGLGNCPPGTSIQPTQATGRRPVYDRPCGRGRGLPPCGGGFGRGGWGKGRGGRRGRW